MGVVMSVADTSEQTQTAGQAPAPRRWRRRIKIGAVTLIVVAIALRIVMIFALPAVISRVGGFYGLDIKSDRQSRAVIGWQAGVWEGQSFPQEGRGVRLCA